MGKKSTIGRNDPCPCGSGKKYKKCCGARLQTDIQRRQEMDHFKLNREIAYIGEIGRVRKNFCIDYIKHKQSAINEIEEFLLKETRVKGETITCHKGCFFCCSQHVSTLLQESEAIVYYLYQHERPLNDFLEAYPKWRAQIGKNESLFRRVSQLYNEALVDRFSKEKDRSFMEAANQYLAQNIPCPFLSDGICSIYTVRPWACASLVATTPAEWCSPISPNKPQVCIVNWWERIIQIPFYRKIDFILSTMPLAVYNILQGGTYYLSKFPGLESLEKEAMNDPEVRLVLRRLS